MANCDRPYNEIYRPQYHYTASDGWLNDPNGLVFYDGEYHLFHQHNPTSVNWGNIHWGHAVSSDLLHWKQRPDALEPDELGAIFSGSAVVDWNNTTGLKSGSQAPLIALYTAAGGETPESAGHPYTQCLAYSNDRGATWQKYLANPVLPHVVGQNRDPKVIWYSPSEVWIMSLFLDGEDYALFSSPNLKHWTRIQTIHVPGASECPDLFPMNVEGEPDEQFWIFCGANGLYLVGEFDGQYFNQIEGPYRLDFGANYYAVQTFSDVPASDGRRVQIAWMAGGVYPGMLFNQQMSFPCALTLHRTSCGLRIHRNPITELTKLRRSSKHWSSVNVAPGELPVGDVSGDTLEIVATIKDQENGQLTFSIRGHDLVCSFDSRTLTFLGKSAPLASENGLIRLHVLIDRASVEIFLNSGELSLSFCFTPDPNDLAVEISASGSASTISEMDIHELSGSW